MLQGTPRAVAFLGALERFWWPKGNVQSIVTARDISHLFGAWHGHLGNLRDSFLDAFLEIVPSID